MSYKSSKIFFILTIWPMNDFRGCTSKKIAEMSLMIYKVA